MMTMKTVEWSHRMRRPAWRGLLVLACLVAMSVPAHGQQAPPPPNGSAPVMLDLAVDGNHTVGGGIVATFAVMARQLQERMQIQIVLPDGVQQTAGDAAWEGTMGPGEVRIVEISAKLSSPGSKRFIGRVTLPGKPALTVERTFDVQPAPAVKPKK